MAASRLLSLLIYTKPQADCNPGEFLSLSTLQTDDHHIRSSENGFGFTEHGGGGVDQNKL